MRSWRLVRCTSRSAQVLSTRLRSFTNRLYMSSRTTPSAISTTTTHHTGDMVLLSRQRWRRRDPNPMRSQTWHTAELPGPVVSGQRADRCAPHCGSAPANLAKLLHDSATTEALSAYDAARYHTMLILLTFTHGGGWNAAASTESLCPRVRSGPPGDDRPRAPVQ